MTIKLAIAGCCGRMGQAIARAALADSVFAIGGAFEMPGHQAANADYGTVLGRATPLGVPVLDDARTAVPQGDVLIEFTLPEPTVTHMWVAHEARKPMVIGTTGLSADQLAEVRKASKEMAIVLSPNMSLGVNVLFELAALAAQRLGSDYKISVAEAHHQHKKDAPSGTAKRLVECLAKARGQSPDDIPVDVKREGDIVGDHTVILDGVTERLELFHHARSRDVFAQGALRAAQFAVKQKPGLYDMTHVLKAGAS